MVRTLSALLLVGVLAMSIAIAAHRLVTYSGRIIANLGATLSVVAVLASALIGVLGAIYLRCRRVVTLAGVSISFLFAFPWLLNQSCSRHYDDAFLASICRDYEDPARAVAIVRSHLAAGADPDARGNTKECGGVGATPLDVAIIVNPELVPVLLKAGADPNSRTNTSETPLHYAARRGDLRSCKALVAAGGDVNAVDRNGASILRVAIEGRDEGRIPAQGNEDFPAVIEFLAREGATLNGHAWQQNFIFRTILGLWS